jgi:NAD(P)H-hydrate repair Nnr-like enzyme with NAD(P)H-hydrate dehydratase domain
MHWMIMARSVGADDVYEACERSTKLNLSHRNTDLIYITLNKNSDAPHHNIQLLKMYRKIISGVRIV